MKSTIAGASTLRRLSIVALLAVASALPTAAETRRALLVGINTYNPVPATAPGASDTSAAARAGRGSWSNLNGCVNDVTAIRELLVSRFGFKAADIVVLTESQATRTGILETYRRQLIEAVKPGDSLLFYYAGHGSQVANSKSSETDRKDESLVPSDSSAGAADIRDKELAALFNESIARGATLTVVLDSCHSGSGSRGLPRPERSRSLPPDPRDAADPAQPTPPESKGALIISAAQDYQTAGEAENEEGIPHGLLSAALIDTLRQCPVNEPAERVFLRTKALMQATGRTQEPVLAGSEKRLRRPLFGGEVKETGVVVAVTRKAVGGTVALQGGYAVGLTPGTELRRIGSGTAGVRLRVIRVDGVASATAEVVAGTAEQLAVGDLFEVDRWVAPDVPTLHVYRSDAPFAFKELQKFAAEVIRGSSSAGTQWIDDPTLETPTHVVSWDGKNWIIYDTATQSSLSIVSSLDSARVVDALSAVSRTTPPSVFLAIPASREVATSIRLGTGTSNDAIALEPTPSSADYLLTGRAVITSSDPQIEYAWVRPNSLQQAGLTMPARTDWFDARDAPRASRELERSAIRLGKVSAWLRLTPPPDPAAVPYRLALRRASDGAIVDRGEVRNGEIYGLVLRTTDGLPPASIRPRWVYVFVLDSFGTSTLLFPASGAGNVENQIPRSLGNQVGDEGLPGQIDIGPRELFTIGEPFGADTYMLLTTAEPLPDPMVLEGAGVRTRGTTKGFSPLGILLGELGAASRGANPKVPANWSLERTPIASRK